jgi:hypothetical protein
MWKIIGKRGAVENLCKIGIYIHFCDKNKVINPLKQLFQQPQRHQLIILGMLIIMTLGSLFVTSGVCNNQDNRRAKVNQLLEIAGTRSPSRPIPEEIQKEKDKAIRDKYFEERQRLFQEEEDNRERARNELAAMGDEIIDQLIEIYKDSKYENHIAIVLKKIGTQKAKETLLNMAIGQNGFNWSYSTAAQNYVEVAKDKKEDIKALLVSSDSDILGIALQGMKGLTIDVESLKRLDEIMQTKQAPDYILRSKAAEVISADKGSGLMREKVSVLVKSLQTIEQLPNANGRFLYDRFGTIADVTSSDLARALTTMKGADAYLDEATKGLTGNARRWMLAVRATKGDTSVKGEIRNFIVDPNMLDRTLLRSYALRGYAVIGTADDIPFLRNIAESDPVVVIIKGESSLETINGKPINNTGDRAVIYDEYTKKEWDNVLPDQRIPFIRGEAESAIKSIEARIKSNSSIATKPNN